MRAAAGVAGSGVAGELGDMFHVEQYQFRRDRSRAT